MYHGEHPNFLFRNAGPFEYANQVVIQIVEMLMGNDVYLFDINFRIFMHRKVCKESASKGRGFESTPHRGARPCPKRGRAGSCAASL
jgi:hypothetical protein